MDAFKWDESLRTGEETLDSQHRELIRQLNLLVAAMSEGQSERQLAAILDFLDRYAAQHFGYEERCMEQRRCPAAEANRAAHAQFIEKFAALRQQARSHPPGRVPKVAAQAARELTAWLIAHILRFDTQLRACPEVGDADQGSPR